MSFELNNDQIYATYDIEHWWRTKNSQLLEIAGPAGSGKTTLILHAIDRLGLKLNKVLFMSYMGKAVSQMIRHGLPAKTIHSSCYYYEKEIMRDEETNKMILMDNDKPKMKWVQHLKEKLPGKPELIVIDEGGMVPETNAVDVLSFGVPVIVLGDLNQLPPVFGSPFFLKEPDIELHQIMRQKEGDPIIYLAQRILNGLPLLEGVYGHSAVIKKSHLTDYTLRHADVILTTTNRLRGAINNLFRESFLGYKTLEIPHYGEKIICRKNDWGKSIKTPAEIYLCNGLAGYVDYVDKKSYNGKKMKIDFKPDFSNTPFRNLSIDMNRLNAPIGSMQDGSYWTASDVNYFEYAYALTVYLSQGSQWENVVLLDEGCHNMGREKYEKLLYTGITRASDSITVVLDE